jgi:hypothetical protein
MRWKYSIKGDKSIQIVQLLQASLMGFEILRVAPYRCPSGLRQRDHMPVTSLLRPTIQPVNRLSSINVTSSNSIALYNSNLQLRCILAAQRSHTPTARLPCNTSTGLACEQDPSALCRPQKCLCWVNQWPHSYHLPINAHMSPSRREANVLDCSIFNARIVKLVT